jgi:hypothetical protein
LDRRACDTAAANVVQPVSACMQMPISMAPTSRILDPISLTLVCRRMTGARSTIRSVAGVTTLGRLLRLLGEIAPLNDRVAQLQHPSEQKPYYFQ